MTKKERGRPLDAPSLKALIAAAPLDGVDLKRLRELGRENFDMGSVEPITSELDYQHALTQIEAYFIREPEPGTPEALHFDALAKRISAYEDELEAQANSNE